MAMPDVRGNPCGSHSPAAQAAAEKALWRMLSFYGAPMDDLDDAIAADPGWALPHTMKAGHLLSLTEAALLPQARAHLEAASALAWTAPAREQAHLKAVQCLLQGRWEAACRCWDALLLDHPRDALALLWTQLFDFYRGDAAALRQRPARALPEWDEADPLFPHMLALHAFGLEECNLYAQAEDTGRRALALDARVPWAVHAVAHVMEMQGRYEDGSAWLRQHQPAWGPDNGYAAHLWWHKSLFRLEAMDTAGALRLLDAHLSGDALQVTLQRLDAASMLWRLHLLGEDIAAQGAALLAGWPPEEAGHYAFNDVHAVMAMLAAGEVARADAWLARCAARALDAADARRSNHAMAREAGLPLMRGLIALARGAADDAADLLWPVRGSVHRLGGSHAQRDVVDQTLLSAAARGSRRAIGRALLNERRMAKPVTPLTRHWIETLDLTEKVHA